MLKAIFFLLIVTAAECVAQVPVISSIEYRELFKSESNEKVTISIKIEFDQNSQNSLKHLQIKLIDSDGLFIYSRLLAVIDRDEKKYITMGKLKFPFQNNFVEISMELAPERKPEKISVQGVSWDNQSGNELIYTQK